MDRNNMNDNQQYWTAEDDSPSFEMESTQSSSEEKKAKTKSIIVTAAVSLMAVVLAVFSVMAWIYVDFREGISVTEDEIEDARVSGTELVELDLEFAEDPEEVSSTDAVAEFLPDEYVVSNKDVSIILLAGSDARPGKSKISRSDSMMLVVVDRAHKKIKIVSIMRDLYAIIPRYVDGRFNSAYAIDSRYKNLDLKVTFSTIKQNLGVSAEDYVIVDFSGFQKIINLLGGVTMKLSADEAKYMWADPNYGRFPRFKAGAGEYEMNGAETLNYCRMRKVGGDQARTERQRKVFSKIVNQLKSADAATIYNIVNSVKEFILTNLSTEEINGFVMESPEILSYEIVQFRVPIEGAYHSKRVYYDNGSYASVLWTNYKWTANELYKFIFEDKMTYANGGKAKDVFIPKMPEGVQTTPPTTSAVSTDTTDTTDTTGITDTTNTSSTSKTTSTSNTSATSNSTNTSATSSSTSASNQPDSPEPSDAPSDTTEQPTSAKETTTTTKKEEPTSPPPSPPAEENPGTEE